MPTNDSRARASQFAPPPDPVDGLVEGLLIALLAFLPFAYGGVTALGHLALVGVAGAMAGLVGLRALISRRGLLAWSGTLVPLVLFVGLVALQTLPIGLDLMAIVSPGNAATWGTMLSSPPMPGGMPAHLPLSLDAHAARVDLALLLAVGTIFFVVLQVYRSLDQVKRLLAVLSLIGTLVALTAFVQHLTDSHTVMGLWDMPEGRNRGGPFVHVGHFSQYLNLSMGCALALLLVRLAERLPGRSWEAKDLLGGQGQPLSRLEIMLWVLLVLGAVMVAMSNSRNGILSMLVAGSLTTILLSRTGFLKGIAWPLAGMLVFAFAVLLLMGFDPVYERLATLEDPQGQIEGRFALLGDSLALWRTSPWLGVGQGAFENVFPAFDHSLRPGTAAHAENQYVELLAETGVAGLVLVLFFVGLLGRAWLRLLRSRPAPRAGLAYGLGFGLLAVALHALTDFGLRTPAVMVLAMVCAGLVVASAQTWILGGFRGRVLAGLSGLVLAALLGVQLLPAVDRWQAERQWTEVQTLRYLRRAPRLQGTEEELDDFVRAVDRAAELDPGNIEYRYWSIVHGWQRAVARVRMHRNLRPDVDVPKTPELVERARSARQDLLRARAIVPVYGPLWSTLGQLGVDWLSDPASAAWIWQGQRLAPHDPATCLAAGRQALRDPDHDEALRYLRRAVAMGVDWRGLIVVLLSRPGQADLARRVVSGNAHKLQWLATRPRFVEQADDEVERKLHSELRTLLEQAIDAKVARAWQYRALAQELIRSGDDAKALPLLRQHLRMEPTSRMRVELARLLDRMGKTESAITELVMWLRSHPGDAKARELLVGLRNR